MPYYYGLKSFGARERRRTIDGIAKLRTGLSEAGIPKRNLADTVLLATWNIRELGADDKATRTQEAFYYIAEILHHFDIVAIQEVREDLAALKQLQALLGGWWKYVVTDVTLGRSGNGERLAFLYDGRKVAFSGLAGEVVLPDKNKKPVLQFARTPFVCGFKAGWSSFSLCTVHVYYGTAKKDDPRRVREIEELAQTLAERGKADPRRIGEPENLVLLGDFNIFNRKDPTFESLTRAGFTVPEALQSVPGSNVKKNKHYDQIALMARPRRFALTGKAGVFDFFDHVFTNDQANAYSSTMNSEGTKLGYEQWRTFQMSDHLVMWCELDVDFSAEYLEEIAGGKDVEKPEAAGEPSVRSTRKKTKNHRPRASSARAKSTDPAST